MARPIEATPTLTVEESIEFLRKMHEVENTPIPESVKKLARKLKKEYDL